ncbi:hypothetical protein PRZ48_014852 [Zasmidium cellare]|uniref:Zn(2)-C6 fungal-type domain-containing protein n=1 Tax=Zasmidium cellare TaxID=395010 RepID=A0ABR0DWV7_ZASCE|nr:hypothetical protein PRZ48_014852 [Zasmidium cellare]
MFSILDAVDGSINAGPRTSASRACDQCKSRKVRCDMSKPCICCRGKGIDCTYDNPRKKRGPPGKVGNGVVKQRGSLVQSPTSTQLQDVATLDFHENARDSGDVHGEDSTLWPGQSSAQSVTDLYNSAHFGDTSSPNQQHAQIQRTYTDQTAESEILSRVLSDEHTMASPNAFIFPSLPAESPAGIEDPFGAILDQELPQITTDVWPTKVNETTLLPWIDVYFKRLHPTIPVLNRTNLYSDMLLRKHRIDPQYGAMLLSLCAFAMTQPVQMHERASMPSRTVQARMLMEESVKMRVAADFGEDPSVEMILASFFLFACLFGTNQHKAARHRLREAIDLAYSLGLHLPVSYQGLGPEAREQWLRTYLVLSVTERAYALQQNHAISFRGQPGITARFMQAFDPNITEEYISSLIFQDQADAVGMTGLLYLMDTFDAIDESVMDCWNGFCRFSDGACESFDRRRALQTFRAQRRVREACVAGNISFAPSVSPLPLAQLVESQQADISVTQFWTWNRLWNLCLSHQLLRETSDHAELQFGFACHIAHALIVYCNRLSLAAMEVHGVGMAEKIFDVAMGIVLALNTSNQLQLDATLTSLDPHTIFGSGQLPDGSVTVRVLLDSLGRLLGDFRGGDHPYSAKFGSALQQLPAFNGHAG